MEWFTDTKGHFYCYFLLFHKWPMAPFSTFLASTIHKFDTFINTHKHMNTFFVRCCGCSCPTWPDTCPSILCFFLTSGPASFFPPFLFLLDAFFFSTSSGGLYNIYSFIKDTCITLALNVLYCCLSLLSNKQIWQKFYTIKGITPKNIAFRAPRPKIKYNWFPLPYLPNKFAHMIPKSFFSGSKGMKVFFFFQCTIGTI
jgi:hypothetical protein